MVNDPYQSLILAQSTALLALLSHDLHLVTVSPRDMVATVPSSVTAVSRRFRWFKSASATIATAATAATRTLVQQVHLPNINLAKTISVAKLDLPINMISVSFPVQLLPSHLPLPQKAVF